TGVSRTRRLDPTATDSVWRSRNLWGGHLVRYNTPAPRRTHSTSICSASGAPASVLLRPCSREAMRVRRLLCGIVVACMACHSQAPRSAPDPLPSSELTLERGDVVRVAVWREPELSGEFPVDDHGELTLPLLGKVPVAGRRWQVLQDSLLGVYAVQLRNPSV